MVSLNLFLDQMSAWGAEVEEEAYSSLKRYARLLNDYDKANVIGARTQDEIFVDHIVDSLACFVFEPLREARNLVDVGSGGGLPGIPLKVIRPSLSVSLLESTGKKADFLRHAVETLNLCGVNVLQGRAEAFGRRSDCRASFHAATARAVAPLAVLAEYCVPLLHEGGYLIAMKAKLSEGELSEGKRAATELGAEALEVIEIRFIPGLAGKERRLVVFKKVRETPDAYPRREGVPAKHPLGRR